MSQGWEAEREFASPRADLDANVQSLLGSSWTFDSNYAAIPPAAIRTWHADPEYPGKARIIVTYRTFNPIVFPENTATLTVEGTVYPEQMTHDLDGKRMIGYVTSDDPPASPEYPSGSYMKVVKGNNVVLYPKSVITLRTCKTKSSISWTSIAGMIGKLNAGAWSAVGAGAETLLMISAGIPRYFLERPSGALSGWFAMAGNESNELIPLQYSFLFNPYQWPKEILVQCFSNEAVLAGVRTQQWDPTDRDEDDDYAQEDNPLTTTTNYTRMLTRTAIREVARMSPETRRILDTADMSSVFALYQ